LYLLVVDDALENEIFNEFISADDRYQVL